MRDCEKQTRDDTVGQRMVVLRDGDGVVLYIVLGLCDVWLEKWLVCVPRRIGDGTRQRTHRGQVSRTVSQMRRSCRT